MRERCTEPILTAGGCVGLALMLLVLPLRWILAWCAAAAVHEGCHALALILCSGRILSVRLGLGGAQIAVTPLTPGRELLCALAGPVGALGLLALGRQFPVLAVCAALQSSYNLLPLYPLDGGRALRCLLGVTACRWIAGLTKAALLALALYGTRTLGPLPLLLTLLLLSKTHVL